MSDLSPLSGSEMPTTMGWLLLAPFELLLAPRPQAETRTSAPAARPDALPNRHALIAYLPLSYLFSVGREPNRDSTTLLDLRA
jgi:hypothetical protein